MFDLFVKGDKGNPVTIAVLKEILGMIRGLTQSGVRILIHRMSKEMLQSDEVLSSLRSKLGIEALPAMVTDRGEVLTGTDDILNFLSSIAGKRAPPAPKLRPSTDYPEDMDGAFTNFALDTMNGKDEEPGDGTEELMKRYHDKLRASPAGAGRGGSRGSRGARGPPPEDPSPPSSFQSEPVKKGDTSVKDAYNGAADCDGQDIDLLEKMMSNIGYEQ